MIVIIIFVAISGTALGYCIRSAMADHSYTSFGPGDDWYSRGNAVGRVYIEKWASNLSRLRDCLSDKKHVTIQVFYHE